MRITVDGRIDGPPPPHSLLLRLVGWNDWFEFRTLYSCRYVDDDGATHELGAVKIANVQHKYQNIDGGETPLPVSFEQLDRKKYASLGQSEDFYKRLINKVGPVAAKRVLHDIGDLAEDPSRLENARTHRVVAQSLLRDVAPVTVSGKFHRIIEGQSGLAAFDFTYSRPSENALSPRQTELSFAVHPHSTPPTNVHVLIGRNGSGKTTLLRSMARAMLGKSVATEADGGFVTPDGSKLDIANLVYVAFSAFDEASLPVLDKQLQYDIAYSYVGLQYIVDQKVGRERTEQPEPINADKSTRPPSELGAEFADSALRLIRKGLQEDWSAALETLQSDPNFDEAEISRLSMPGRTLADVYDEAMHLWPKLSSGHKIVLLTVTRLVETVTERTMVLMDEPEGHLHPPLLSALIRTLSDLLKSRNGVAIVATHSPVILQEVPKICAWKVRRTGLSQTADRPSIETFGESVGVLTSEVFSLEVTDSGFHRMLTSAALEFGSYEKVVAEFQDELGFEARATLRAWFATQSV